MTFKEFQEQYITAVKQGKVAEYPKEMFSDFKELAEMYADKIKIVLEGLRESTNLADFEKLPKIVDDLNSRAFNIFNNYRQLIETVSAHNEKIEGREIERREIVSRLIALENKLKEKKS